MKKKNNLLKKLLLMAAVFVASFYLSVASAQAAGVPSQEDAYNAIIALKSQYPEGMRWTNSNYYGWRGGIYSGGYGCAGFAFICSDAAFGDLPARVEYNVNIKSIKVGDILRINNNCHSVVVLEIYDSYIVITEGNFNSSIHWGRTLTASQVANADYVMTRYPAGCANHTWDDGKVTVKPTATTKGIKKYTCTVCGETKEVSLAKLKKQTINVSSKVSKTVTYKASKFKRKSLTLEIGASAKTKLSYRVTQGAKKYITVSKEGVITLKKGIKKGTYKVRVTASESEKYVKTIREIKIKIQ